MPNLYGLAIRVRGIMRGPDGIDDYASYMAPDGDRLSSGTGHNDRIASGSNSAYWLYGDAFTLTGTALGGRDQLYGADGTKNWLVGDANAVLSGSIGGNDRLIGGSNGAPASSGNNMMGDAVSLIGSARGGDDVLIGGANMFNGLIGDAMTLDESARGGNDTLRGGGGSELNIMFGDAQVLGGSASCGNDRLFGSKGTGGNMIYGDAYDGSSTVPCGDDLLVAGDAPYSLLIGDVGSVEGALTCGDDRLISGRAKDILIGDVSSVAPGVDLASIIHGRDTFVFSRDSGQDQIVDFESGVDHIELSRFRGIHDFADLTITFDPVLGLTVSLGGANTIFVGGAASLTAEDFIIR